MRLRSAFSEKLPAQKWSFSWEYFIENEGLKVPKTLCISVKVFKLVRTFTMKPNLALFDFDGTLTRKDTLFEFVIFVHGNSAFYRMMISILPWLVFMKLNLASAQSVKERLLRKSIGGLTNEKFSQLCKEFCSQRLPQLFRET